MLVPKHLPPPNINLSPLHSPSTKYTMEIIFLFVVVDQIATSNFELRNSKKRRALGHKLTSLFPHLTPRIKSFHFLSPNNWVLSLNKPFIFRTKRYYVLPATTICLGILEAPICIQELTSFVATCFWIRKLECVYLFKFTILISWSKPSLVCIVEFSPCWVEALQRRLQQLQQ